MSLRTQAELIPAEYRKEILETNMIASAQAIGSDPAMNQLFTIWKNYIEPGNPNLDMACSFCLQNILTNWKGMQDVLVDLEVESKLLNAI